MNAFISLVNCEMLSRGFCTVLRCPFEAYGLFVLCFECKVMYVYVCARTVGCVYYWVGVYTVLCVLC